MKREDFQLYSQDLFYRGEAVPSNEYTTYDRIVKTLLEEIEEYENFIANGVEFGYIEVPEIATDKAKDLIKKVLG